MPDLNISGKQIFSKLGIIKHELLIFAVLICVILNAAAVPLDKGDPFQHFSGATMHFCSVFVVLLALAFYIYAYLNLAPSIQALAFVREGKKITREHKGRRPKPDKPEKPEKPDE